MPIVYGEPLPTRQLGKDGPWVSALGYGAMGLSIGYGQVPPTEERLKVLDGIVERGCYFIDTSDIYGDSEDLIGEWFRRNPGLREKIFLATKFAMTQAADGSYVANGTPEYVRSSVEKSLGRLGVEYIDLFYVHRIDQKTPIEVTMRALKELKEQGKIRHIGLSEAAASTIRRAHAISPISALQIEYSPFALDIEAPENGVLATARELGIAIVGYSPLGRGFFTGRYRSPEDFEAGDFRRYVPRFSEENFPKNLELVDKIKGLAEKKGGGVTSAQVTLAWILGQGADFIPIPGSTRFAGLDENFGSLKVELTEEESKQLRQWSEDCVPVGERYPAFMVGELFGETPEEK